MTWLTWPNRITIVRIFLILPLVVCLMNLDVEQPSARRLALVLFCLVAAGDALDGYLARRLRQETPLGRFLDPLADKLLMTSCLILLAWPGTAVAGARIPNWVPVLAIGKDVLITVGFGMVYVSTRRVLIHPRVLGKGCTLVQSALIAAVLLAPDLPEVLRRGLPGLYYLTGGLAVAAAVDYFWYGNRAARRMHQELNQRERVDE